MLDSTDQLRMKPRTKGFKKDPKRQRRDVYYLQASPTPTTVLSCSGICLTQPSINTFTLLRIEISSY